MLLRKFVRNKMDGLRANIGAHLQALFEKKRPRVVTTCLESDAAKKNQAFAIIPSVGRHAPAVIILTSPLLLKS